MEKAKEKPPEFFKSIKTSLKSVLKNPEINSKILNDTVIKSNKIVIHTLQFLKLYLLDYYENNNNTLPDINKELINNSMKVVCGEKKEKRGKPANKETTELKNTLMSFFNEHYLPLTRPDPIDYAGMNTILDYLKEDVITMYENNIQLHYVEYVERYVNVVWKKKMIVDKIRKLGKPQKEREARVRALCAELRKIKNDLLNVDEKAYQSSSHYHKWITEQKQNILPRKNKYEKNSIYYDLKCSPIDYFPCVIFMMKRIENEEESVNNIFPLRSEIAPKYIRLDTTTLVNLLLRKEHGTKAFYKTKGELKKNEDKIWEFFFRTERKMFCKTGFSFHHMVSTDGVGLSILFLRNDLVGKKLPMMKTGIARELYIDELDDYSTLQNKTIVGIDPGKEDLIYCVDDASNDANVFRYSQDQRRKETKMKKYNNIILAMKTNKIEGKTIIEYETELSHYNRKSLNITKYKEYLHEKNRINNLLFQFYRKELFRKLKFGKYINVKRNEQKMVRNFKKTFGNQEEVVICIGDWEQRKQMKYKEPTLGKGIRTLFRKNNYKVFLVDEFRTSCKCSNCNGGVCEKFRVRKNPRPKPKKNKENSKNEIKYDEMRLIHGLLRCKSGCGLWNRDRNGSSNIYKIANNAINNIERPGYLCRETSNQGALPSAYNQTLCGYEKTQPLNILLALNVPI
jgi:hypothetical protein